MNIKKARLILLICFILGVFVSCNDSDYLGNIEINILDSVPISQTYEEIDAIEELLPDIGLRKGTFEVDYHSSYIHYSYLESENFSEADIRIILEELSSDDLNEYEEYNKAFMQFYADRYLEYNYEFLYAYDMSDVKFYNYDVLFRIDLDNDGMDESLMVYLSDEPEQSEWHIVVDDVDYPTGYYAGNAAEQYAIVSIENVNRIILSDIGLDFEGFTLLLTYKNDAIINMCDKLEPNADEIKGLNAVLTPNVAGINIERSDETVITIRHKLDIVNGFSTWKNYQVRNGYLYEIPYKEQYYPTYFPVFLMKDIELKESLDEDAPTFDVEKGQVVIFTGTDDKEYICISGDDEIGWISIKETDLNSTFFGFEY